MLSSRRLYHLSDSPSRLGLSRHAVASVLSSLLLSPWRSSPIISPSKIVARARLSLTVALLCSRRLRFFVVYNLQTSQHYLCEYIFLFHLELLDDIYGHTFTRSHLSFVPRPYKQNSISKFNLQFRRMGKKSKGSRKGKKAWRANISTAEIEDFFEKSTKDALSGGSLSALPSDSLFVVDKSRGIVCFPSLSHTHALHYHAMPDFSSSSYTSLGFCFLT